MAIYEFEDKRPKVGKDSYVSESADVIGDVVIGKGCYVAPGARLKGDYGGIRVGDNTNVQENAVMHAREDDFCRVGKMVHVGHGSILHNCTVKDYAIVGMGAVVSDYAIVGVWTIVGEGCVVKQRQEIPDGKVCVGVPARVVGDISEEQKKEYARFKEMYVEMAKRSAKGLKRVD